MTKRSPVLIALPLIAWLLVFHQSLFDIVKVWNNSKTFDHCYLIVPICLWLIWQKRNQIKSTTLSYAWAPTLLLLFPALLWLVGRAASIALFEHAAAILSLQLLIWALIGNAMARLLWFPICYLVFCVPFGEEFIPKLQVITADLSVFFLRLTDIPVYREGLYLTIPNGLFFVAEACSGIRFLMSSIALGTLFAYVQFSKTWKRIIFVGFSFIFPIIANGIRAYGIVLIGYLTDMEHATGADHLVYGWFFFSIVILCIFAVGAFFADPRTETKTDDKHYFEQPTNKNGIRIVGLITVMFFSFAMWGHKIAQPGQQVASMSPFPEEITAGTDPLWGIDFPKAQQSSMVITANGDATLFSARYALWQSDGELISHENHFYDNDIWSIKQTSAIPLPDSSTATQLTLTNKYGKIFQVVYWYCIDDYCSSNPLEVKLYNALHLLRGGAGHADVFAISSQHLSPKALSDYARNWQRLMTKSYRE